MYGMFGCEEVCRGRFIYLLDEIESVVCCNQPPSGGFSAPYTRWFGSCIFKMVCTISMSDFLLSQLLCFVDDFIFRVSSAVGTLFIFLSKFVMFVHTMVCLSVYLNCGAIVLWDQRAHFVWQWLI
ncbi:hypothetical protein I3843_11G158600 [Carya illinoinensis]|uniref:Uncharacterized protein n=1 Tax=Carya illinoinensis TaxID=32201 RepID=A0A922J0I2_CARIL|nr:hypothetical protein I3760_11G157700 [Carya illinoinensis]KAG6689167.1 hypothetical protein I3842_11G160900 [Carya illinoinensis]KAG7957124.1 hypothetical protein I3843_11G158600 [Carya illinoinensis]